MEPMFLVSFRFSHVELAKLDSLVHWERTKGPATWPAQQPNRTSLLKALVSRELIRLADEKARISERLAGNVKGNAECPAVALTVKEIAKQRKSRLQRERRAGQKITKFASV